ncbi:MAG TPA: PAS domain S-box protein, partial [Nitrospirota bacterium]|nr:PAS domain S-box protein [Nitrospirota bacterium]
SIFSLLALQMFGIVPGAAAGLIISFATYFIWNHPYAIVIMTCEVVIVGFLIRSNKISLIMADAIYWGCIGAPFVFLFYHLAMGLPLNTVGVTIMKQSMNGLSNAIIARLLFVVAVPVHSRPFLSLREVVFNLVTAVALFASLAVLAVQSRAAVQDMQDNVLNAFMQARERIDYNLGVWLTDNVEQIDWLARKSGSLPRASLQERLEDVAATHHDFVRLGIMNKNAITIAYVPARTEKGKSTIGLDLSDRPYLSRLKQDLKPMLSDVIPSRVAPGEFFVAMLTPILSQHRTFNGFVSGVVNINAMKRVIAVSGPGWLLQGMQFHLLDREGRIVLDSDPRRGMGEAFVREPGDLTPVDGKVSQWMPKGRKNISVSDQWQHAIYTTAFPINAPAGWKLVLDQPLAPFEKTVFSRYSRQLLYVVIVCVAAIIAAELISRRVTSSIMTLGRISSDIPNKLKHQEDPAWPAGKFIEINDLAQNMRTMTSALQNSLSELDSISKSLEDKVRERTRALLESEVRYRKLFESSSDAFFVYRLLPDGLPMSFIDVNQAGCSMFGYSREELLSLSPYDLIRPDLHAGMTSLASQLIQKSFFTAEFKNIRKSGEPFDVGVTVTRFDINGKQYGFAAVRDITEQVQATKNLVRSEEYNRTMIRSLFEGILVCDRNGSIESCNPSAERILGLTGERLIGSQWFSLGGEMVAENGDVLDREARPITQTFITGKEQQNRIVGVRRSSQPLLWLEMNTSVLSRDDMDRPLSILVSFADVSARKMAEGVQDHIHSLAVHLSSTNDLLRILSLCTNTALNTSQLDCGGIYLVEQPSGDLMLAYSEGLSREFSLQYERAEAHSERAARVAQG